MKFSNWKNHYIDLVTTLPDLIVAGKNDDLDEEECAAVRERMNDFPKTIIELGSGSGIHLIERAESDPENLYVGFELRYKRAFKTAEKAQQRKLTNVLVVRGKAQSLLTAAPETSIAGIYINFPDPWEKKKWLKHRLLSESFIKALVPLLSNNGFLSYKTDHQGYFEATCPLLRAQPQLHEVKYTQDLHKSPFAESNVLTEFEKLFISKDLPTYLIEMQRKA